MITVKDTETGERVSFRNVNAVLREINRDRSRDFSRYTKHDWKDGLENMTQYTLVSVRSTKGQR